MPEAVVACDPGSMRDPSQIFEMHFLEDFPPRKGEAAVQLTVDPETIWYQVGLGVGSIAGLTCGSLGEQSWFSKVVGPCWTVLLKIIKPDPWYIRIFSS